jgi:hypothetical protein
MPSAASDATTYVRAAYRHLAALAADRPLTCRQIAHGGIGRTPTEIPADRPVQALAAVTGMSEERTKDPTAPVGPLLENFAIGEVAHQLSLGDRLTALPMAALWTLDRSAP